MSLILQMPQPVCVRARLCRSVLCAFVRVFYACLRLSVSVNVCARVFLCACIPGECVCLSVRVCALCLDVFRVNDLSL